MIAAVLLALAAANSPLAGMYALVHHTPVHFRFGPLVIDKPLVQWINEGLMVIFFLVVGLEIKRQFLEGHFANYKCAVLPFFAALGGIILPSVVYAILNWTDPNTLRGWAIPTATDIVLALGVLSLLGSRVLVSLKIFLTALAIFDDIGAVIIVGLFYGEPLSITPLLIAGLAILALFIINRFRVVISAAYIAVGLVLWLALLKSGAEAALTGLFIALAIPLHVTGSKVVSPLRHTERQLHAWNVLLVIPLFAFFNAGITINSVTDTWPMETVSIGVIAGLFFGKQIGVFFASRAAVASGLAQLPEGITWPQLYGISLLAGIGFTMSTFVATLAFDDPAHIASAKLSILLGSFLSALAGFIVIYLSTSSEDIIDTKTFKSGN